MTTNVLPPVTHVASLTTIRRQKILPAPGTVFARLNERVQAVDVVAEAEPVTRHLVLDVARGLGLREGQVQRFLKKQPGDRVEAGDVIAGPVGLARRVVRAPVRGRVVRLVGPRVLLEAREHPFQLRAGFPGMMVSTDGEQTVVMEASGALIQGVWGNGKQEYGVLRLVSDHPGARLVSDMLDIDLRGAVLVAGWCDQVSALQQAKELLVRGLILGGLDSELVPLVLKLPYPVIVLEGFGELPINRPAFELLSSKAGREAALDARPATPYDDHRPEIIIPLPTSHPLDMLAEVVPLEPGVRVHLLRPPHRGAVGVFKGLQSRATAFPSGVVARSATVELEGIGTVVVPVANLEVLQ